MFAATLYAPWISHDYTGLVLALSAVALILWQAQRSKVDRRRWVLVGVLLLVGAVVALKAAVIRDPCEGFCERRDSASCWFHPECW